MKYLTLFVICACIGLATATHKWDLLAEHEVVDNYAFSFKVALKPQNMDVLDNLFWEVSNPKSPFYGNFLDNEQIADLISLPEEDIVKVEAHFNKNAGQFCNVYTSRSLHRDYLYVDTCAAQAKAMFPNLTLAVYQGTDGHKVLRHVIKMDVVDNLTLLGLPFELHQYIEGIHDVTDMPVIARHTSAQFDPSSPWLSTDKELTVQDMIEYFGVTYDGLEESALNADVGQVRQAVIEFGGAAFSPSELSQFQEKYDVPSNPIKKVIGTEEGYEESVEASLDVQTITAIAQNVQTWDFVFGNNFDFIPAVDAIMGTENAPRVISASYGEPETIFGQSKVTANNTAFMKLGLAGYTFFAASGDVGPVLNPDTCGIFDAEYPSSSPYVTAVGGTVIDSQSNVEAAWIHSSGGFSVYNSRPSYQDSKVESYLSSAALPTNSNGAKYNTANRAYPDVAAFGAYEPVLADGSYQPVGGTSGACPQFAGLISLINIHRYQNGLGPLGALNQALYSLESGVGQDVTNGQTYATSRYGCDGQFLSGFAAVAGWDAATGLGSPKFQTLLSGLGSLSSSNTTSAEVAPEKVAKKVNKKKLLPSN